MSTLPNSSSSPESHSQSGISGPQTRILGRSFQLRDLLLTLLLLLALIKLLFLSIDPAPGLFMGDSGAYLNTALKGLIPGERSFTYGYVLRAIAVWPHSLRVMVLAQAALSTVSCWIVALCLVRYFQSSLALAAICSVFCAIEPLQLLSERYVLTESVATFLFALFVLACFEYLRAGSLLCLGVVQVLGVLLVSIRISFLPIVLFTSIALPFGRLFAGRRMGARPAIIALLFSVALSQTLLYGYRHLYGYLVAPPMHGHPAYFYRDGLFLLSDFAPLVSPNDLPIPGQRTAVFGKLLVPLTDPRSRDAQRWGEGGLCSRIIEQYGGDEYAADPVARKTALRAIKHHPFGVLRLGMLTLAEYFDRPYLMATLLTDNGSDRRLEPSLAAEYKSDFGEDFLSSRPISFSKWWQEHATLWYWYLLALPFLFLVHLCFHWRRTRPCHWLCEAFLLAFLEGATVTVTRPTARFLTTMAWLALVVTGASLADVFRFVGRTTSSGSPRKPLPC